MLNLSRKTDPPTSGMAARDLIESGEHDHQCKMVFGYLLQYITANRTRPTSAELAKFAGLDRYVVARRLPDLENKFLAFKSDIRPCTVSRRKCVTWGML